MIEIILGVITVSSGTGTGSQDKTYVQDGTRSFYSALHDLAEHERNGEYELVLRKKAPKP